MGPHQILGVVVGVEVVAGAVVPPRLHKLHDQLQVRHPQRQWPRLRQLHPP